MYRLIVARIAWMDQVGIDGWNHSGYLEAYPAAYFVQCARAGMSYGVWTPEGRLAAAAVLLPADSCWQDDMPARYVHNLVSAAAMPGAGAALLARLEAHVRAQGISRMRLDAAAQNNTLNAYYEARGYHARGTCQAGPYYQGILREKLL